MGIADDEASVAVECGPHAACLAVLGNEVDLAVGHVHILKDVADFVVVDLLVNLFMIAHVLVEIDDRAVLRGHVALYEDERAFGMGEVEHVILL